MECPTNNNRGHYVATFTAATCACLNGFSVILDKIAPGRWSKDQVTCPGDFGAAQQYRLTCVEGLGSNFQFFACAGVWCLTFSSSVRTLISCVPFHLRYTGVTFAPAPAGCAGTCQIDITE